jgi:hypothetical protein
MWTNFRRNTHNQWGKGKDSSEPGTDPNCASARLHQATLPMRLSGPARSISRSAALFAMGSCFAREIEKVCAARGLEIMSRVEEDPAIEASGLPEVGLLNRYNTASMLLEFRRLLEGPEAVPDEALLVDAGGGLWFDAHYHQVLPDTREAVIARRHRFWRDQQGLRRADVIVVTLGLTEAGYDPEVGLYRNVSPTTREMRRLLPVELHILSFAQNLSNLHEMHRLIREHCKPGALFVVTVSPIPLTLTYTDRDVIEANAASKATLRAAADEFFREHDDVVYFPSYEMATLADPAVVWRGDKRHIEKPFVRHIIDQFIRHYVDKSPALQRESGLAPPQVGPLAATGGRP